MSIPSGQNPYPGYGQQPMQGYGGYGQPAPGQPQYPMPPSPSMQPGPPQTGARRSASRALPLMVAAGLAVGVCSGLVLVLGTGDSDAASTRSDEPSADEETAAVGTPDTPATEETKEDTEEVAEEVAEVKEVEPPKPAPKKVTLNFDVEPEDATITVDEQAVTERYSLLLEQGEEKQVKIVAKASGYRTQTIEHTITGNDTLEIKLERRPRANSSSRSGSSGRSSGRSGRSGRGSGGLIDL